MSDTDLILLHAARGGDPAAATQLVDLLYGRLYAFLRRLSGSEHEACDLTQRTFIKLWQALPGFQGRSSVSSWAHSIAYRTYVDWLRTRPSNEAASDAWWESCPAPGPDPSESASQADQATHLYGAVDRLDPDLRTTVHLHYYQGLSIQDTADAMGVATSTVKYRVRQAVDLLRNDFGSSRIPSTKTPPPAGALVAVPASVAAAHVNGHNPAGVAPSSPPSHSPQRLSPAPQIVQRT